MSKHTPGPWYLDRQFESEGQYNIQLEVYNGWRDKEYMRVGGCCSLANALLIAAAPDLLEALKGLVKAYEAIGGQTHQGTWHSHALHAIDKATGEKE